MHAVFIHRDCLFKPEIGALRLKVVNVIICFLPRPGLQDRSQKGRGGGGGGN